jgi:transcriptional regulator with XRE-family HTH domain
MTVNCIGKNIAEMRKSKGVTQEALAEFVGVSSQAVSKWESGGTPDVELLAAIADYFEVSIDRLFGRSVNDYGNLEVEVAKFIAGQQGGTSEARSERFKKAVEMCWVIERALFGDIELEEYMSLDKVAKDKGRIFTQYISNEGITNMSLREDLRYFLIMPEPLCGFKKELGLTDDLVKFLKLLSDENVIKALYLLNERVNKQFTPMFLVRQLSVTNEQAVCILNNLKMYNLISTSEIELDDENQTVYNFKPNPAFVGFLAMCNELIQRPKSYYYYNENRDKPYLL